MAWTQQEVDSAAAKRQRQQAVLSPPGNVKTYDNKWGDRSTQNYDVKARQQAFDANLNEYVTGRPDNTPYTGGDMSGTGGHGMPQPPAYDSSWMSQKQQGVYGGLTPQQQQDFQNRFPQGANTPSTGGMPPPPAGGNSNTAPPPGVDQRHTYDNGGTPPPGVDQRHTYDNGGMQSNGSGDFGGQAGTGTGGGMPPPPGSGAYDPYNDTNTSGNGGGGQGSSWGGYGDISPADYQSVQQYSDAAYDESRRYLDPQQEQQDRRFQQEMVNKGIDPQSPMGQQMYENLMREQGNQNSGAAFNSMQFGQGIQDQMAQQALGWGSQATQRYGIDKGYDLGMGNLDLNRQGQEFDQMMGLDANQFRNNAYNNGLDQYRDQLYMAMYGQNPVPAGSTINPDGTQTNNGWGWGYNQTDYGR